MSHLTNGNVAAEKGERDDPLPWDTRHARGIDRGTRARARERVVEEGTKAVDMNILFVHQNFPGQYRHLARYLATIPGHRVVFITQRESAGLPGDQTVVYRPLRQITPHWHRCLRDTEAGILNAQAVARVALQLKKSGFVPDVMIGHNGWGEIWYLKDVFPQTPLLGYFEFPGDAFIRRPPRFL